MQNIVSMISLQMFSMISKISGLVVFSLTFGNMIETSKTNYSFRVIEKFRDNLSKNLLKSKTKIQNSATNNNNVSPDLFIFTDQCHITEMSTYFITLYLILYQTFRIFYNSLSMMETGALLDSFVVSSLERRVILFNNFKMGGISLLYTVFSLDFTADPIPPAFFL